MLQSAGRFMTPFKGAAFKHIPLEQIIALLGRTRLQRDRFTKQQTRQTESGGDFMSQEINNRERRKAAIKDMLRHAARGKDCGGGAERLPRSV
jgi:hypothetical protein